MQIENSGFVTGQDTVVLAGASSAPEEDVLVHRATGDVLTAGVEAGGEDFSGVPYRSLES